MTNKITCILVDDDRVDMLTTAAFLEPYPFIELAGSYSSAEQALGAAQARMPDAMLMDIDMPGLNGLQLRRQLMQIPACIFITSYPDYALESFDLAALDFLVKPLNHDRFAGMIHRLNEYISIRRKADMLEHALGADTVFIKDGTSQVKLQLHEIVYLEALNNYTSIVTATRKYTVLSTLSNLIREKGFSNFIRIHRSYAVQKHFIKRIGSGELMVGSKTGSAEVPAGDICLPVGRSYKHALDHLKKNTG
jgi:two-component system, LytTR family, response regulator